MCLLAFCLDAHPEYALVFAGNRDEQYDRPTAPATFWKDAPHVLAGRDLKSGGTWMGVTRAGHWSVVTNVRDPEQHTPDAPSRGHLVSRFLRNELDPEAYLTDLAARADRYNGFNLLCGSPADTFYLSNRPDLAGDDHPYTGGVHRVESGVHGLSNHLLDTPWPKVSYAMEGLNAVRQQGRLHTQDLLDLLNHREPFPDEDLPDTGVGPEAERMLSPLHITSEHYGTRSATVLLIGHDGTATFAERTFKKNRPHTTRRFSFQT